MAMSGPPLKSDQGTGGETGEDRGSSRQDRRGGAGKGWGRPPTREAEASCQGSADSTCQLSPLTSRSKHWIFSYHQIGRDRLPLPHLFEKERGACVAALIAQITRPVRFHVPSILGTSLATDNDPIDAAARARRPQVKWLKQWRDR